MRFVINNRYLTAVIDSRGAELKHLHHTATGIDHLWHGDAAIWGETAPFLFPVVARQLDDRYTLNGNGYMMPMHGFAKDCEFSVAAQTHTELVLELTENETTLQWYPFPYRLITAFKIEEHTLQILRTVSNTGTQVMPYSIGEHPGFAVPMLPGEALEDYHLQFSHHEDALRWYLDNEIICGSEPYLKGTTIPITSTMFDQGALIFKKLRSDRVSLKSKNHEHSVTVRLSGWDYLGIWAKPGAPYVCIEPWNGLASSKWSSHDIFEKEGIRLLAPGASKTFETTITLT